MTARERILMIRLLEKLEHYPGYGKTLGIEATGAAKIPGKALDPKGCTTG